jgi:hypothetical protein
MVTFETCIRGVFDSILSQDTDYSEGCHGYSPGKGRNMPSIRP